MANAQMTLALASRGIARPLPVLHLRESATKMGLLRKHHGKLLATSLGRSLLGDPAGLWWQLAERMPPRSADPCETQAGLFLLTVVAAGVPDDPNPVVARLLGAIRPQVQLVAYADDPDRTRPRQ
jgi:hypothetical protein